MTMTPLIAYHGRADLKARVLAELARHRAADQLAQNNGYFKNGKFCAVGCTLHSLCVVEQMECRDLNYGNHALYEQFMGVPQAIARLEDGLFEALPQADAQAWPERFARAIRPGADLSMVVPRFLHWLLTDPEGGVQAGVKRRPQIEPAVRRVVTLYETWFRGMKPSVTEWREARSAAAAADAAAAAAAAYAYADAAAAAAAAYAAAAAADAAAAAYAAAAADAYAYAAAAAAYAAAAYAADADARYRSRQRQADHLIALLEAA
jgi:hypothetical protein